MRPLGRTVDNKLEKVSELILRGGQGWNFSKLEEHFVASDINDILKTPIGRAGATNFLFWNFTKNGAFSVKSAYHLGLQHKRLKEGVPESSVSC
jgi:hypothetical protein